MSTDLISSKKLTKEILFLSKTVQNGVKTRSFTDQVGYTVFTRSFRTHESPKNKSTDSIELFSRLITLGLKF